jgi:hypothetical protein
MKVCQISVWEIPYAFNNEPAAVFKNFLVVRLKTTIFNSIVISIKKTLFLPQTANYLIPDVWLIFFFYSFPVGPRPILVICGLLR